MPAQQRREGVAVPALLPPPLLALPGFSLGLRRLQLPAFIIAPRASCRVLTTRCTPVSMSQCAEVRLAGCSTTTHSHSPSCAIRLSALYLL